MYHQNCDSHNECCSGNCTCSGVAYEGSVAELCECDCAIKELSSDLCFFNNLGIYNALSGL